jgi:hypothetical protein
MGKPRLDTSDLSPCFSELTGADLPGIIVMARAAYWSPTRHAERRGKRWIAKDQRLWSRETSLTERQIKDTFIRLRRHGLIETKQYLFGPVGKERSITHLRLTTKTIHAIIAFDPAWAKVLEKNYGGDVKTSLAPKGGDGKLPTVGDGNPSTPTPPGDGNPATQGDGNPSTLKQARKNKLESKKTSEKVQLAASGGKNTTHTFFLSKRETV